EHLRTRPPLLAGVRRSLPGVAAGRGAGRRLPILFPPARLPERLLAVHAAGAGSAFGPVPEPHTRLARGGPAAGERLGCGVSGEMPAAARRAIRRISPPVA